MEYRSSEVKAGFFIFMSFIALVVLVFMLGDLKNYFRPKKELQIIFNFAGGLEIGAPVRYSGLEVGRVKDIVLSDFMDKERTERVSVTVEINPAINIKKNSSAMIKTSGLMGGFYIDVRPGSKDSLPLKENEPLIGQDSFEFTKIGDMAAEFLRQIERVTGIADSMAVDMRKTLGTLQNSLTGINNVITDNREYIKDNLKNLSQISHEFSQILANNKGGIEKSLEHLSSFTKQANSLLSKKGKSISSIIGQVDHVTRDLETLLAENRPGLTNLIRNMESGTEKIATEIEAVSKNLDETLQQGNALMIDNRHNLLQLIKNLKDASENLKDLSGDIKRNPWKLVRKTDEKLAIPGERIKPGEQQNELRIKRLGKISSR